MENRNIVAYSQNDFIWNTMEKMDCPTDAATGCHNIIDDTTLPNAKNCLNVEYCRNQNYSNQILNGPVNHMGAQGRFLDSQNDYNATLQTTVNLGIGIFGIGLFIFYYI